MLSLSVLQNSGDVRNLLKSQAEHQLQIQDWLRNLASLWCVYVLPNDSDRSCLFVRKRAQFSTLPYHSLCFHTADHNLVNDNLIIRKRFFKEMKCSLQQQNSSSKCNTAAGSVWQEQVLQSAACSQSISTLYKHTSIFAFGKHNKIFLSRFTAGFSNAQELSCLLGAQQHSCLLT